MRRCTGFGQMAEGRKKAPERSLSQSPCNPFRFRRVLLDTGASALTTILLQREFRSADKNPNVNGDQRLITITETGGQVRMVVSGIQGANARLVTISDCTIPLVTYEANKATILASLE